MGCGSSYPKKDDAVAAVPPSPAVNPSPSPPAVDQVAPSKGALPLLKVTAEDIEKAMKYEMADNAASPRSSIRCLRGSSTTPQGSPTTGRRGVDKFEMRDDGTEKKAESIEKKVEEAVMQRVKRATDFMNTSGADRRAVFKVFPKSPEDIALLKSILSTHFLFKNLMPDELEDEIQCMEEIIIETGTTLFSQNDTENPFFYITKTGSFSVLENNEKVDLTYSSGSTFGELTLLNKAPRKITVTAREQSSLWRLDREVFRQVLSSQVRASVPESAFMNIQLLEGLDKALLNQLALLLETVTSKENEVIIKKGEIGSLMYFIKSGTVKCTVMEGVEFFLSAGEYFGERAFLSRNGTRKATVTAVCDVVTLVISFDQFKSIIGSDNTVFRANVAYRALLYSPWFKHFSKQHIHEIISQLEERRVEEGEVISKMGNRADSLYVIQSGELAVWVNKKDDEQSKPKDAPSSTKDSPDIPKDTIGAREDAIPLGSTPAPSAAGGLEVPPSLPPSTGTTPSSNPRKKRSSYVSSFVDVKDTQTMTKTLECFSCYGENGIVNDEVVLDETLTVMKAGVVLTITRAQFEEKLPHIYKKLISQISSNSHIGRIIRLDDLEQLRVIGKGCYGTVFLVQDRRSKTPFVLKTLSKELIRRRNCMAQIKSEKTLMAELRHPFLVEYYTSFQTKDCIHFLMEFVQGGELLSGIRNVAKPKVKVAARFYCASALLALEYMHDKNILYRDLKPENILITLTGYVKICDFGFAKKTATKTFTLCGTPEYLSPELVGGRGHHKASDYWALGILLYELLYGYTPFAKNAKGDHVTICSNIVNEKVTFPASLAEPLEKELIKALLNKDEVRLGVLEGGINDIKKHEYFSSMDFTQLLEQTITPPWVPDAANEADAKHFHKYPEEDTPPFNGSEDLFKGF